MSSPANSKVTAATRLVGGGGDARDRYDSQSIIVDQQRGAGDEPPPQQIGVYPRRWFILFLYSFSIFLNQAQYTAFSTIVTETKAFYNTNSLGVNMLSAVFSALYVILVFPSCLFYQKAGFRIGMILSGVFDLAGALLKLGSVFAPHYAWLIFGQACGGFAQCLLLSLPPMVASLWFPASERTLATAIGTLSGFVGISYSFFVSPRIIQGEPTRDNFMYLWLMHTGACAACLLGAVIVVRDAPPLPPSVSAQKKDSDAEPFTAAKMLALMKKQACNFSFMRLCFSFGLSAGMVLSLATVLSQVLLPFQLTEQRTGVLACVGLLAGAISCTVVASQVDRYRMYKGPLLILFGACLVMMGALALCMAFAPRTYLTVQIYCLVVPIYVVIVPTIPVVMEFAVEKTFPDPEMVGSSFGIVFLSSWAVIGGLTYSAVLGDNPTKLDAEIAVWICCGVVLISLIVSATVKPTMNRQEHERRQQSMLESPSSPPRVARDDGSDDDVAPHSPAEGRYHSTNNGDTSDNERAHLV